MQYIHIRSLEKYHPGYKDRELKFAKIFFNIVQGDPDCELIDNEIDRWRFIAMICLELQAQKPLPDLPEYWTKKGFDVKKRPMSLTLQMLQKFILVVTENKKSCGVDKDKEEDKEEEKERTPAPSVTDPGKEEKEKHLDFVFLTQVEYKELKARFGENALKDLIFQLNVYIGSKGIKYKSHYYTILSWARRDKVPCVSKSVATQDELVKRQAEAGPPDPETRRKIKELIGKATPKEVGV